LGGITRAGEKLSDRVKAGIQGNIILETGRGSWTSRRRQGQTRYINVVWESPHRFW